MIELLKRLETKGVPLKIVVHNGYTEIDLNNLGVGVAMWDDNPVFGSHAQWHLIGCVVEYMEAQGWTVDISSHDDGSKRYLVCFETFGQCFAETGNTLLETVLAAADRAPL